MSREIVIRRALTDRQFDLAKTLLGLPVDNDDLWRAMAAIVAYGINERAGSAADAAAIAGDYCVQFLDLVESGRRGEFLAHESVVGLEDRRVGR